jgi:hypothetical protein
MFGYDYSYGFSNIDSLIRIHLHNVVCDYPTAQLIMEYTKDSKEEDGKAPITPTIPNVKNRFEQQFRENAKQYGGLSGQALEICVAKSKLLESQPIVQPVSKPKDLKRKAIDD